MTFNELVREYFPGATDEDVDHILWEHTGFPCFWDVPEARDPEVSLRKQLQELKDSLKPS